MQLRNCMRNHGLRFGCLVFGEWHEKRDLLGVEIAFALKRS